MLAILSRVLDVLLTTAYRGRRNGRVTIRFAFSKGLASDMSFSLMVLGEEGAEGESTCEDSVFGGTAAFLFPTSFSS